RTLAIAVYGVKFSSLRLKQNKPLCSLSLDPSHCPTAVVAMLLLRARSIAHDPSQITPARNNSPPIVPTPINSQEPFPVPALCLFTACLEHALRMAQPILESSTCVRHPIGSFPRNQRSSKSLRHAHKFIAIRPRAAP